MHHIDMYWHFLHAYHSILACTSYFYSTEQTSASYITFISVIYNLVVIYKIHNMQNNSIRKTNNNLGYAPLFCVINPSDNKTIADYDTELNPIQECRYYADSNLANILSEQANVVSLLSLNIQSLNAKFDQLHVFVQQFRQNNNEFSAICLQESSIPIRGLHIKTASGNV